MTDLKQKIERALWQSLHRQGFDVVGQFSVSDLATDIVAILRDISCNSQLLNYEQYHQLIYSNISIALPGEAADKSAHSILNALRPYLRSNIREILQAPHKIEKIARTLTDVYAKRPNDPNGLEYPVISSDPDFDNLPLDGSQGTSDDYVTQEAVLKLAQSSIQTITEELSK